MCERAKPVVALFSRIDDSNFAYLTAAAHEPLKRLIDDFQKFFEDALGYDPKGMRRGSIKYDLFGRLDVLILEHYSMTQVLTDYLFPHDVGANDYLESIKTTEEDCNRYLELSRIRPP